MGSVITSLTFPCPPSSYGGEISLLEFVIRDELSYSTQISSRIPIRYYQYNKDLPTILICHGNYEDMGQTNPYILAEKYNVNICLFDYAGYGLHSINTALERLS